MERQYSPARLDVRAFAEDGAELTGQQPVRDFPRLSAEAGGAADDRQVTWAARGEAQNPRHLQPEIRIHLQADAVLPLTCQRCLEPVDVPLHVNRSFRFVADEATAAAEDEESEEDVLALSRSFDLPALVEDELLMEAPLVPRHEVCPSDVRLSVTDPDFEDAGPAENPFARLQVLKGGKEPH